MSAVPKKKLCWNCEGNVAREIDNCPYCAVYLHAIDSEEDSSWNPSYRPSSEPEEVPSPLYQLQQELKIETQETLEEPSSKGLMKSLSWLPAMAQLKQDIFPLLFLMMGSVFFLFGIVLLLFSQNGILTLQWQGHDGYYFLLFAFPLIFFGWKFFQQLETHH